MELIPSLSFHLGSLLFSLKRFNGYAAPVFFSRLHSDLKSPCRDFCFGSAGEINKYSELLHFHPLRSNCIHESDALIGVLNIIGTKILNIQES